jgi:hypothetical protein
LHIAPHREEIWHHAQETDGARGLVNWTGEMNRMNGSAYKVELGRLTVTAKAEHLQLVKDQ